MLFDALILVDFSLIFDNFDGGIVKNTFFSMGGRCCFHRGFLVLLLEVMELKSSKGQSLTTPPLIFLDILFDALVLVDFCLVLDNFDGGNAKNTLFSMRGC